MNTDILIIGGGVIGLAIARLCGRRGLGKVTLIERGRIGMEASHAAGGMLAVQAETEHGGGFLDFCTHSRNLYPELAESLREETGIDIQLEQSGTLFLSFSEDDVRKLTERHAWQTHNGLNISLLSAAEVLSREPRINPTVKGGLFFPQDWQVENRRLIEALAASAVASGVKIIEGCEVESLIFENSAVTGAVTDSGRYFAKSVVLAAGSWSSMIPGFEMQPQILPVKGEMIVYTPATKLTDKVIYSERGYAIPRIDGRLLVGATSELVGFDKSTTGAAHAILKATATEIFPCLEHESIVDRWAGLRPFAGRPEPIITAVDGFGGLIVASGHYRNGILLAPATAELVVDLIAFRENRFSNFFGTKVH